MNALRIRKRLDAPVPGFPELTPLVGRTVEIIVLEEAGGSRLDPHLAHRVRVVGRIGAPEGDGSIPLVPDTGERLHLWWVGIKPLPLPATSGQRVAVDAVATFDADGRLTRLEADGISPARPGDDYFSRPPRCVGRRIVGSDLRQPQTPAEGMARAFGAWPSDESEEQVLRALEEVE